MAENCRTIKRTVMKKMNLYAAFAVLGIFASCNTEQLDINVSPLPSERTVTLTVNDAAWTGDDTRTAFTPSGENAGSINLTGTELISLYYKTDETHFGETGNNIKASPSATPGEYSFTIPAAADGQTHWFGLMPYSSQVNGFNSQKTAVSLRLGPVQFPAANSFDPHCDYLVARPFDVTGAAGAETGEIASFKRLFAPLCLRVSGLEEGDKIYTATLSLSQATATNNALAGVAFVNMDDSYAGTTVEIGTAAAGNAVSAEYAIGLEAVSGSWPVWLMVNPITIVSGGTVTLTVSTASKTYIRTATLTKDVVIGPDQLNLLRFNIKGAGYTELESVTQDFTAQTLTGDKTLTASDGSSVSWTSSITRTFTSASNDNGSGITGAMVANGQDFTFPTIPGKNIVGARIFCHPASRYGGGADKATLTIEGTTYQYNLASYSGDDGMCYSGGVLNIPLPAGRTSLAGLTVTPSNQQNLISAITLFTEDDPAFENDYYAQYEAGRDISINGTVFNKATNGPSRLLKLYEMANTNALIADYTSNGILFLDYDEADGETDTYAPGYRLQPNNVVIIGRYRNHQPHIDLGNNGIQSKGAEIHLKNVKISAGGWMFVTSNLDGVTSLDVNIEDCTLNTTSNYVFIEDHATNRFHSIVINNSIIKLAKSLYEARAADKDNNPVIPSGSTLSIAKLWVTNSVVFAASEVSWPTIALRTSSSSVWYTPSLDLKLEYNTFYNLTNNNLGLVGLGSMAKLNVNYCVGDATLPKASPIVMLHAQLATPVSDSYIRYNYFNDRSGSYNWSWGYSALSYSGVSAGSNTFPTTNATPFSSTNTTTGYFPINTSVVTNGAGASYDTKLWTNWE